MHSEICEMFRFKKQCNLNECCSWIWHEQVEACKSKEKASRVGCTDYDHQMCDQTPGCEWREMELECFILSRSSATASVAAPPPPQVFNMPPQNTNESNSNRDYFSNESNCNH